MRPFTLVPVVILTLAACRRHEASDVEEQIAAYGLDYCAIKRRAARDARALPEFFQLWRYTDAGGAEDYCTELPKMLEASGEFPFLEALDSISPEDRKGILSFLSYEMGLEFRGPDWRQFSVRYPTLSRQVAAAAAR